ncbi:type II secretion system protein [Sutcliffiella horikoshii]|uniref:type II secretion system protein n=1 Tax=Sutcliffiella horikoshii TaxID=79883 RepID=UPI001CFCCC61|nr:prepilin-type N-terminal cleavage/methylation domain-containing protein [Sutcliffiella horikoshii]
MLQKCRKMLRNEKGLTLIELLAVVVILGIIAAIAIPSIGNIIEKSRNDAHVANAQQIMSAARLALANNDVTVTDNKITVVSTTGTGDAAATTVSSQMAKYIDKIDKQYTSVIVNVNGNKVQSIDLVWGDGNATIDKDGKKL